MNAVGSGSFNVLAISSVATALLALKGRVYENRYIDALESSFLLNLGVLSVATIYIRENELGDNSQALLSGLSVGTAFVTFLGIFLFHVFHQLKKTKMWKDAGPFCRAIERPFVHENGNEVGNHDQLDAENELICSAAQLRESLLDTKSSNVNTYGT